MAKSTARLTDTIERMQADVEELDALIAVCMVAATSGEADLTAEFGVVLGRAHTLTRSIGDHAEILTRTVTRAEA